MIKKIRAPLLLILTSLAGLLMRAAFAQERVTTDNLIEAGTRSGDTVADAMQQLFGTGSLNPLQLGTGQTGTLFNDVFLVLNLGALCLGTIWFLYTITAGTVQTAADGEWLGRRYSSVWLPIRTALGISSCAPVFFGWSALQWITLCMAFMGNGLANMAATKVAESTIRSMNWNLSAGGNPSASANELTVTIATMNTCRAAYNMAIRRAENPADSTIQAGPAGTIGAPTKSGLDVSDINEGNVGVGAAVAVNWVKNAWNNTSANSPTMVTYKWGTGGECGQIEVKMAADGSSNLIGGAISTEIDQAASSVDSDLWRYVVQPNLAPAGYNVTEQLDTWIKSTASNVQQNIYSKLPQLSAEASNKLNLNQTLFETQIKENGWMTLGVWFMTVLKTQQEVSGAMNARYFTVGYPTKPAKGVPDTAIALYGQHMESAAQTFDDLVERYHATSALRLGASAAATSGALNGEWGIGIVNWLITSDTNTNPLIAMKRLGDNVVDTYLAVEMGTAVANVAMPIMRAAAATKATAEGASAVAGEVSGGAKGALGKASGLLDVASDLKATLGPLFQVLFFAGLLLAYYVPMIPFINWFAAILTYFATLIEGLFAGPVHAMAHMDGEGEGMGQRTSHGYLFMFNLFLRPILMVGGFLAACGLVTVLGKWLMTSYQFLLADVTQDNWTVGPISIVVYVVIYCILCLQLVNKSFDLCHMLPDAVMAFIGAPHMSRGEQHMTGAITAAIATGLRSGGLKFSGNGSRGAREAQNAKRVGQSERGAVLGRGGSKPGRSQEGL